MSTSSKHWYQFKVIVNYFKPEDSKVVFPQDPLLNPIGKNIDQYLVSSDMCRQENIGLTQDIVYFARNKHCPVERLIKLYFKFSSKGAVLEEIKSNTSSLEEEVKELKKLYKSNQKRLEVLKTESQQLKLLLEQKNQP